MKELKNQNEAARQFVETRTELGMKTDRKMDSSGKKRS